MPLKLNSCQEQALVVLEQCDHNVFLTGHAGTGKSFLIRHFMRNKDRKVFPVVASTGAAAVLIGGRTFHSFFGLGIMEGGYKKTVAAALAKRRVVNRLKKIDGFILDEVSMIPGMALRAAESICRQARKDDRPWGGAQVIAVGDFAQLPPVSAEGDRTDWAFLDEAWDRTAFEAVCLETVVRSQDKEYVAILNKIRQNQVDDTVEAYLNRKTNPEAVDTTQTHLFARRLQAEKFCEDRLAEINRPLQSIPTSFAGDGRAIERLKKVSPIPDVLNVKESAFVMLRINDPKWRYVNGSVGTVEKISDDELIIALHNGRVIEVPKVQFSLLDAEGKALATASNFPVTLAYAVTIHKAQGATLESLVTDLRGLWDPGQAYVALSRLQSGDGLTLTGWDRESIHVAPEVVRFHQQLESH